MSDELAGLEEALAHLRTSNDPAAVMAQRAILRVKFKREASLGKWQPRAFQVPPELSPEWDVWMMLGGRGSGKTRAGAEYVLEWLRKHGRKARVGVGAPTLGDARDVAAEGESGLITIGGDEFVHYNRHLLEARHYKGGFVKFLGSERPARWNGPQWNLLWADELALWNHESWIQAQFGVRLHPTPHIIVTTTPKNRKFVRDLAEHSRTRLSRGATVDNPDLAETAVARLYAEYGGSRLGVQELMGEFIDDVEGALWRREWIDDYRVHDFPPLERIVVAIDPASTHSDLSDYTAICVAGVSQNRHFYILKAERYRVSPADWAKIALRDYDDNQADEVIVEANFGKDLVLYTLRNVLGESDILPPIQTIHHKRGKVIRADPVAALYESGRVHHVGIYHDAESEMCTFPIENEHDDLVDAITMAVTQLGGLRRRLTSF